MALSVHACEAVISPLAPFLDRLTSFISTRTAIPLQTLEIDHVCYRCATRDEYKAVVKALVPEHGVLLVEGMIGGRPIATIALHSPLEYRHWRIRCIEVPCPKAGRAYKAGLEHAEVVIGTLLSELGTATANETPSPHHSRPHLEAFIRHYASPSAAFDTRAIDKDVNADVSLSFPLSNEEENNTTNNDKALSHTENSIEGGSVKFHVCSLFDVATMEKAHGLVEAVPAAYFVDSA